MAVKMASGRVFLGLRCPEPCPDFRELLTTVVHRLSIIRLCEAAIG